MGWLAAFRMLSGMIALGLAAGCGVGAVPRIPAIENTSLKTTECDRSVKGQLCLGLKLVVFVADVEEAHAEWDSLLETLAEVNGIWRQCKIQFQVDEYLPVDPKAVGLDYGVTEYDEFDGIRETFVDGTSLLVVATGPWDREGEMGDSSVSGWTLMPGDDLHGTVVEKPWHLDRNLLAHELGHYLDLDHTQDRKDLMAEVMNNRSEKLDREECARARRAARIYWPSMIR